MFKPFIATVFALSLFGLSGCDMQQNEEGTSPNPDVGTSPGQAPTNEGQPMPGGELPDADADVESNPNR